ncbi:hypothetical protein [Aquisalimonas asiatica]|uniref:Uncharacterized protein n=1 Tax=Aquisalimonas asiatica TaxID=406100 RepID=A0A1H8TF68_9GAMM|nr:hypothetical protein [Aquisalimonas asiatica]SEO89562.1 hypothetical protein SAMN04488052_104128 [Aquisalimonas asiatica]
MSRRTLAVVMIVTALVALFAIARYPTEPSWQADDPRRGAHLTAMAWWQEHLTLAHQDGTVWQRRQGDWEELPSLPEEARSTVLLGGDGPLLAGTTRGILTLDDDGWTALTGEQAPEGRISHLAQADDTLVAADNRGVWRRSPDGDWSELGRPDAEATVYRVMVTPQDNGDVLVRSGSIEAGVHLLWPGADDWVADNDGLPADIKVLSFHTLPDGTLLAGTDEGLFRQQEPMSEWQQVGGLLGDRRVLTLAHDADRLYAGSDDGVWRAPLADDSLEPEPDWLPMPAREGQLDAPVAWVLTDDATPWIVAGSAYNLRSSRTPEWYILVIGAPVLLVGGGLLLYGARHRS